MTSAGWFSTQRATSSRALLWHSALYGAARVAISAIDLLLLPLYTRVLTTFDYGQLAVGASLQAALALAFTFGMDGALFRLYYASTDAHERRRAVGGFIVGILSVAVPLAVALSIIGPAPFGALLGAMPEPMFHLLVWGTVANAFPIVLLQLYQMQQQSHRYLVAAISYAAIRGSATILAVLLLGRGAIGWAEAFAGTAVASALVAVGLLKPAISFDRVGAIVRDAVGYAVPQFLHQASAWLAVSASRLVLAALVPLSLVAMYQVGLGIGQGLGLVTTAVSFAYGPAFMESATRSESETTGRFGRLGSRYVALLVLLGGGITVWRDALVRITAGPAYAEAGAFLPIIVAAFVLQGMYFTVAAPIFLRKEIVRQLPIRTALSAVVGLGSIPLLVPRLGITGAAIAALVANVVLLVAAYPLSQRSLRMDYDLALVGRAALLAAVVVTFSYLDPFPRLSLAAILLAVTLSGVLAWWAMRVLGWRSWRPIAALAQRGDS